MASQDSWNKQKYGAAANTTAEETRAASFRKAARTAEMSRLRLAARAAACQKNWNKSKSWTAEPEAAAGHPALANLAEQAVSSPL